jgi:hypothetical protein
MDQPLAKEPMLLWKTLFQVRQVNVLKQNPHLPRQQFETPLIEAIKRAEEAVHQPPPGSLNGDDIKLRKNQRLESPQQADVYVVMRNIRYTHEC